jgi:hypothetical protein
MFDFDVVTGPSDLAKRNAARRSPAPTGGKDEKAPPGAAGRVSGIVAEESAGYPDATPG